MDRLIVNSADINPTDARNKQIKKPHPKGEAFLYGAPGTITQSAVASGALPLRARRKATRCSLLRSESNVNALSTEIQPIQKSPTQWVRLSCLARPARFERATP